jgi:hypothetical protein
MYKLVKSADAEQVSYYVQNKFDKTKRSFPTVDMPTLYVGRNYYQYNDYNYIKDKVSAATKNIYNSTLDEKK